MKKGLPAFRWQDGRLEYIDGCHHPGNFEFDDLTLQRVEITGASLTEVELNAFKGIVAAGMKHDARFHTDVVIIGEMQSSIEHPYVEDLVGGAKCREATHVANVVKSGAFELYESKEIEAGADVGVAAVGARVTHARTNGNLDSSGKVQNCDAVYDEAPPFQCDAPVGVKLVPLDLKKEFEYYFDDRVVGARTEDVALTTVELTRVAKAVREELGRQAKLQDIKVSELLAPSPTEVGCRVAASTAPKEYLFECRHAGDLVVQETGDRQTLEHLAPKFAGLMLDSSDPTKSRERPASAGRVVLLVDVSLSMVVNDETTFTTDDSRKSKRYELVMLLLRGMQENGINPEVAVITFSGAGCVQPLVFKGEKMWRLTDESRKYALGQLPKALEIGPECPNPLGTDLVGPLQVAGELLKRPKSGAGGDAVILITDGAQHPPAIEFTPKDAAAELHEAGAELTVVRIQLNDLTDFRATLHGPSGPAIRERWKRFVGVAFEDDVDVEWEDWITEFSHDEADALLMNLTGVEISDFFLSADDVQSEPLLTAHKKLLPQLGGIEPVFSTTDNKLDEIEGENGDPVVQVEYRPRIIRGRPFAIRIKKPDCMGRILSANVRASGVGRIPLTILWEDGAIVTFAKETVEDDAEAGATKNNAVVLTVEGEPVRGMKQCEN